MKVYRGPRSSAFSEESHQLVDSPDIKKGIQVWHDEVLITANISKDATERHSVAHLSLDATDVMTLHSALIGGLAARSANLAKAERRAAEAKEYLFKLYNMLYDYRSDKSQEGSEAWLNSDEAMDLVGSAIQVLGTD